MCDNRDVYKNADSKEYYELELELAPILSRMQMNQIELHVL